MSCLARCLKLGLDTNPAVATRLINNYASSSTPASLSLAHQLFDQVPNKDTILWSSIISAHTQHGHPHIALHLFSCMLHHSHPTHQPNHFVYASVARACGALAGTHLQLGRAVHARVIKSGFMLNYVVVETAFLDMYSKCGVMDFAMRMFDEMPIRSLVTWNAMISGFIYNEMEVFGLDLFYLMKCQQSVIPDEFTVACVLMGCARIKDLKLGAQVHAYIITNGYELNCVNSMCNMYFQCSEVSCAERVLNGIEKNAVLKLIKIRGYVFNQMHHDALKYVAIESNIAQIFEQDYTVFVPVLTACAKLSLLRVGRQVHGLLIALINSSGRFYSLEDDGSVIGSALIDMYCKCRSHDEARKVFDNWLPALHLSYWNSFITGCMYNGLVEEARILWENMPERNVISWTSMISGYVQNSKPQESLYLLAKMHATENGHKVEGNCLTFVSGLEACSRLTDTERGRQIHAKLIRTSLDADIRNVIVGTALVDMYSKSGNLNYAQTVFDRILEKNVPAWTAIITGYAVHGLGSRALDIFFQMRDKGFEPNEVTFVSVLTACSRSGLVEEGLLCFKLMKDMYRTVLREDHYACLIDMFGRVGRLDEAWNLLEEMDEVEMSDASSSGTIWGALLGACHLHGNVELGRRVAHKMLDRRQQVPTTYITLANVYAGAGMWNEAYAVRKNWRSTTDENREPGFSQICSLGEFS